MRGLNATGRDPAGDDGRVLTGRVVDSGGGDRGAADGGASSVADMLARLLDERIGTAERLRILAELARAAGTALGSPADAPKPAGRGLVETFLDITERLTVRDLATLRRHHPGLDGEQLADALVASATRTTTAVGAALGAAFTSEYAVPPALASAPVQLAAETVAVAAIETKLLAELHAVYGVVPHGGHRAGAYVMAWAEQRGIDPLDPVATSAALGALGQRQVRRRLVRRVGSSLPSLAPMLIGAVAGGVINRRETQNLAARVRADLRRRSRRRA
ncbi:MAG: hypothetical protein M3Q27_03415 [Actinomycetota bacterium]|nr:hypothetical protein [Actinomycetota bacterium]